MKTLWSILILTSLYLGACAQTNTALTPSSTNSPKPEVQSSEVTPTTADIVSPTPFQSTKQKPVEPTRTAINEADATAVLLFDQESESVRLAIADLSRRLNLAPDEIKMLAVIKSEFTNQAFYCQVSKERTQKEEAPQNMIGETILLEAQAKKYEYHAQAQTIIFCREVR